MRRGHEPWIELVVSNESLGSAVSHRLASDHGGVLGFRSEEGKGTAATLRLPVCEAARLPQRESGSPQICSAIANSHEPNPCTAPLVSQQECLVYCHLDGAAEKSPE
jgi:hypothetical protein